VVESANVIMATYADDALGDTQVYPEKGTVCFSAGLHGWAFTLTSFAKIYANKFGVEVSLPPPHQPADDMATLPFLTGRTSAMVFGTLPACSLFLQFKKVRPFSARAVAGAKTAAPPI